MPACVRSQAASAARLLKPICSGGAMLPSTCGYIVPLAWAYCRPKAPARPAFVQSGEAADSGGRAKPAGRRGAEKTQSGASGEAKADRDIDADRERGQEGAASDAALALGPSERGWQQRCHGVQNRGLVDAVIFLA